MLSFNERGLLDTLRKECWVNKRVPSEPRDLAALLNKSVEEVLLALTPAVLSKFDLVDGFLISPELENYRQELQSRAERMSSGGRIGGKSTQDRARQARSIAESQPEATLKALRRDEMKGVELKGKKTALNGCPSEEHREWIEDYDRTDSPDPRGIRYSYKRDSF